MNAPHAMDLTRLRELLDRHGPDLRRFPAPERAAALQLLASDAGAQQALRAAEALHGALDSVPGALPSAALQRRIAEIPLRHPQHAPEALPGWMAALSPLRSLRRMTVSAVMVVALGALFGSLSADESLTAVQGEDGWEELSALAFATELDPEVEP